MTGENSQLGEAENRSGCGMMGSVPTLLRGPMVPEQPSRVGLGPGISDGLRIWPTEGRGRARVRGPPLGHVTRPGQGRGGAQQGSRETQTDRLAADRTDRRLGSPWSG